MENEKNPKPLEVIGLMALVLFTVFLVLTIITVWTNDSQFTRQEKTISELQSKISVLETKTTPISLSYGKIICDSIGNCK